MKKITTLLILIIFLSCKKDNPVRFTGDKLNGKKIYVVRYDNCEYLIIQMKYDDKFTHKGNCDNH